VETPNCRVLSRQLTMTYDMTRLQRLPMRQRYLVSVNPGERVDASKILDRTSMSHPRYTFRTLDGQDAIARLQGHRATWYAGAHLGFGFHEDGCRAGYDAAAKVRRDLGIAATDARAA
jgi:predicted NAD/FAD-binding protein